MKAERLLVLLLLAGCAPAEKPVADLVLHHGMVYTMDSRQPVAQAVAIQAGRIVAVGSDDAVRGAYQATREIDLGGQMVLPGFHDAHLHPVNGGVALSRCDLSDQESVADLLARVRGCDEEKPGTGWLLGSGWELSLFPQANPGKQLLDEISTERPILLRGADGHSSWVNSKALELAAISRATPNPPLGVIERDSTGEPSGTLRESAQDLVESQVPATSAATYTAGLRRALEMANRYGITSMIEASAGREELAAYRALNDAGELTARVVASVDIKTPGADDLMLPADRGTGARLRVDAAKIFVDGVLEGETAALLDPYHDRGDHRGTLNLEPEVLAEVVTRLAGRGIQVHMHAIGDRAVRAALSAVEAANSSVQGQDNRPHIAHLQLIDAADRPRFSALGVTANFQALWAYPDDYITGINLPQVGETRVAAMYPVGSLQRAGANVVGGSDWPVSSMNPLLAIQVAVTRQDPYGEIPDVLNPSERVTLPEILAAYTINGAWLMHQEQETGSVTVGKWADLVVLERDLYQIPFDEISKVRVVRTLLAGETVYQRPPR